MNQRSRGTPKTKEQSMNVLTQYKESSKLYNLSNDDKSEAISNILAMRMLLLDEVCKRGKVDLRKVEEVEAVTFAYLDNCRKAGIIPTFEGMAFSLGYTRRWLYSVIKEGNTETAEFLDKMRTLFADITQIASSKRLVDNAVSIFILKSMTGMGFSDKGEAPDEAQYDEAEHFNHDELLKRYGHLLEE